MMYENIPRIPHFSLRHAAILAKNESYRARNLAIALVECEWIEENKLATKKYDHGTDWKSQNGLAQHP